MPFQVASESTKWGSLCAFQWKSKTIKAALHAAPLTFPERNSLFTALSQHDSMFLCNLIKFFKVPDKIDTDSHLC